MDTTTPQSEAAAPRMLACRTVLVPLDGSPAAERAMPTATALHHEVAAVTTNPRVVASNLAT